MAVRRIWIAATGSPLRRRVVAAMGAGAFAQGVTIVTQLLSLPAFMSVWSTSQYGVWLMLSAIPVYLAMSDVGLVTAVGNQMTMSMGRGETAQANAVFHSATAFVAGVCLLMVLVMGSLAALLPQSLLTSFDARWALAALAAGAALTLAAGLSDAIFKATNRYSTGLWFGAALRLSEWAGWMFGLFWFGSFAAVAIGGLVLRLVGTLVMMYVAGRGGLGITWSCQSAAWPELRRLIKPAGGFVLMPVANGISFQGITLLVGHQFGPAAVGIFNTYRTLGRIAVQLSTVVSHSLWAEMSRLYGLGGAAAVSGIYKRANKLCAVLVLVISLLLIAFAPAILEVWTRGAIAFEPVLLGLLLACAAANGVSHVPRVMLFATNQHLALAAWSLGVAAFGLLAVWMCDAYWGLPGVGAFLLLGEAVLAAVAFALVWRAFHASAAKPTPQRALGASDLLPAARD
jgi:O-antigen/teichoic acid export membrane protein